VIVSIVLEGVLCEETETPPAAIPQAPGVQLAKIFGEVYRTLHIVSTCTHREAVVAWLDQAGIEYTYLDVGCVTLNQQVAVIQRRAVQDPARLAWAVVGQPEQYAALVDLELPTIMVSHPKMFADWRTRGESSWVDLGTAEDET
jgi:hypothetical protein